jgi:hypothetical protein
VQYADGGLFRVESTDVAKDRVGRVVDGREVVCAEEVDERHLEVGPTGPVYTSIRESQSESMPVSKVFQ